MTKEQARKIVEKRGYKVTYDMSAQSYLATPLSGLRGRYAISETLNGLEKATRPKNIY